MQAVHALRRHWRVWLTFAAAAAAGSISSQISPPDALDVRDGDSLPLVAALSSAALVSVPGLAVLLLPSGRRRPGWMIVSAAALLVGAVATIGAERVQRTCTVAYGGRTIVAGTEYTPLALEDLRVHPDQSREQLIFDATGHAETVWTRDSVERCRTRLASTYFLPVPLFALCLLAAAQAAPAAAWAAAASRSRREDPTRPVAADAEPRYDVFLSYRHEEPDRTFARELLALLEADGYRVAIDERDFRVNESFLAEMERCIRESRYTVAILSSRYLQSGNCEEEAVICKILDMGERRRRLIPIFVEPVTTPIWLHGIVGIDATRADALVEPFERLKAVL